MLILIDWYLPGYKAGGPIQSVANLIAHLKNKVKFSIVTRDTDYGDPHPYPGIQSDQWNDIDTNIKIYYLSKKNQNLRGLRKVIKPDQYDIIYLNSVFSYRFTILPLLAFRASSTKFILAPRGMLGEGALDIKSLKKRIFIKVARFPGLYDNITWQATNIAERSDIYSVFGEDARVQIASNIPSSVPDQIPEVEKRPGDLKLVYLSRISEKKDLLRLLEQMQGMTVEGTISLDLYGPIEDEEYWSRCKRVIDDITGNINVEYLGAIQPTQIRERLLQYHFFVLLTKHENFGHAIFEALAAGCPPIISDTTPWHILDTLKIGWEISLNDLGKFDKTIASCLVMGDKEYRDMSTRAHKYALDYLECDDAVEQSIKLFTG